MLASLPYQSKCAWHLQTRTHKEYTKKADKLLIQKQKSTKVNHNEMQNHNQIILQQTSIETTICELDMITFVLWSFWNLTHTTKVIFSYLFLLLCLQIVNLLRVTQLAERNKKIICLILYCRVWLLGTCNYKFQRNDF